MRTTKSVWPLAGKDTPFCPGATCEDAAYLKWLLELEQQGFEIGLHNVTYHTSTREQTIRGFKRFKELFGHDPRTFANHTGAKEGIYWCDARLSGLLAVLYNVVTGFRNRGWARGHIPNDPLFWGDVCQERIRYARNFVFDGMNTLNACPWMPYYDHRRPYVNYWFASSPGPSCNAFCKTISEEQQDMLEEQNGACIMYTHFANGFLSNGCLNSRFRQLMERLAKKGGFYVPVGELLDYIRRQRGHHELTDGERSRLERQWLLRKLLVGTE